MKRSKIIFMQICSCVAVTKYIGIQFIVLLGNTCRNGGV
jgi:hypothetical protein